MLRISFKPSFVREVNALPVSLQQEVLEKIELFKDRKKHASLRVHKLHGPFRHCFSFSVNYQIRIVFEYASKSEAILLGIGDHDIYK